ncbi:MAG: DNA translocase FtsK 4TM domain-containing protein [Deltaproteobacteria bacterium]|nr:DNA translocase FtsK 4TM domain-containing protein [Kofleriaceae bacterium]
MAKSIAKKAAAPLTANRRIQDVDASRGREVFGVIALGTSLFVLMAMVSLQANALFMGPFGRTVAGMVYGIAGFGSYALVILAVAAAVRSLMGKSSVMPWEIGVGVALGVLSLGVLLHLVAARYRVGGFGPGGATGEHVAEILRALISTAGTALLGVVSLAIAIIIATPLRMRQVLGWIAAGLGVAWGAIADGARATARFVVDVLRAIMPERREYEDEIEDEDPLAIDEAELQGPPIIDRAAPTADFLGDTEKTAAPEEDEAEEKARKPRKKKSEQITAESPLPPAAEIVALPEAKDKGKKKKPEAVIVEDAVAAPAPAPALAPGAEAGAAPLIVESRFKHADKAEMAAKEKQAEAERGFVKLGDGAYQLPGIGLLNYDAATQNQIDKSYMLELSARLSKTLENYGVKGDVVAIRPGPVVTMYEFAPAPGTRVAKIANLSDDLAMSLEALRVRIVAPIPGKAAVGIEVPNKAREKVFLKEIVADDLFRKSKSRLPMAIGKDIEGGPSVVDLARMPHLLVAGTTGSGKSVAVNAMITSLLYHCSPDDVRMIMVDPKMLELSIYEGIPHLLLPVVTDPKKANLALRWAVEEMDRRYDLLAQQGVRDIIGYNDKLVKIRAKWEADKLRRAAEAAERAAGGASGEQLDLEAQDEQIERVEVTSERGPIMASEPPPKMPYIVVVIDEFADLMMCAPKEVETSVARIAQKARACGIHLILATQRPSVDVITGLIKANFPSRIAFHVTSKVDSRTILDQGGAEALLGAGDMLFSDRGAAPCRLHGCFVDEDEIHKVVAFLKTQGRPVYNLDILRPREEEEGEGGGDMGAGGGGGKVDDEMYDKAVHIVCSTRNASISWVQRQLRIGYNRAARLVEEMEKQGVVSPPDHTNKREVLVSAA